MPAALIRAAVILTLAACHPPASSLAGPTGPTVPDGVAHQLLIEMSACHTRSDVPWVPRYDGEVWHLGESTEVIRCPIAIEPQDVITGWSVYGRHVAAGAQVTTACLQRFEVVMVPGAEQHFKVPPCRSSAATTAADFWIFAPIEHTDATDGPWWRASEDDRASLIIYGNGVPGDIVGGAAVYVTRP
jgi:hypothetical protein